MNMNKVSRDERILAGLAILLAIGLIAFPWFAIGPFTFAATSAPDGWLGIIAFLAALALVADLAVELFSPQTQVPMIGSSRVSTRFVLAVVTAVFVALKFLFHIHFDWFGWGFYFNVIVTAGLVYVALQQRNGMPVIRTGGRSGPPVIR